jgi:hypothetical protein
MTRTARIPRARLVVFAVVLLAALGVVVGSAFASAGTPGHATVKATAKRVAISGHVVRNMSPYASVGIGGHAV